MGVETAILGGAAIAGGASIAGGLIGAKGSKDAAKKAKDAQMKMYHLKRADLLPWMEAGEGALDNLVQMIEKGPGEFVPSEQPGYKFGYEEFVEKPTMRAASALGTTRSGKNMKALSRYSQDYASQGYDKWLNRYYQKLQPYQNLATMGMNAATQVPAPNTAPYAYAGKMGETNALLAGMSGVNSALQAGIAGYNTGNNPYANQYQGYQDWYNKPKPPMYGSPY